MDICLYEFQHAQTHAACFPMLTDPFKLANAAVSRMHAMA